MKELDAWCNQLSLLANFHKNLCRVVTGDEEVSELHEQSDVAVRDEFCEFFVVNLTRGEFKNVPAEQAFIQMQTATREVCRFA